MKKLIAILAVMTLIPFTAFGFQAVSDDAMKDLVGQAGVDLTFGGANTVITANLQDLTWGDSDGYGAAGVAGEISIGGTINAVITIGADSSLSVDVDGNQGIVLSGLENVGVAVTLPDVLTLGVGPVGAPNEIGTLGLASSSVTIALPTTLSINAH